jgi:hypothetical protein
MNTKFILCTALLVATIVFGVSAQDYIKPINGKGFYANVTDAKGESIKYTSNRVEFSIPKNEVVLIEYLERGIVFYNKQHIDSLDLTNYSGSLYAKGNNVYVPFASDKIAQRVGSITLRNLLKEDNFWNIVDCEEEAHCIIEYVYDESGSDHAYIQIKDRQRTILYKSSNVSASDWIPHHAGKESATKLYKKIIKKKIQKTK